MLTVAERALQPLDRARSAILQAALGVGWLRAWLLRRERRIAVVASLGIVVAFVATFYLPMALYALTPIVLGVPHVASDVRYLVVRQRLPRAVWLTIIAWCLALFGLRLVEMIYFTDGPATARTELAMVATGALALAIYGAVRHPTARRRAAIVLTVLVAMGVACWVAPTSARLVLGHAHNLVALAIWLVLFRRGGAVVALPLALLATASALILGGVTFPYVVARGAHDQLGANLIEVADWLAPGLGAFGVTLTLAYVFWQAIHYSVWLGWIPQEETRGQGSLTFRQSLRSLVADFGWGGIAFVISGMVAMLVLATFDLHRTRDTYLFLAGFHAYLEVALVGYLWIAKPR